MFQGKILISYCFCSKGKKAHCRKLEELFSERNSDDRYAPEDSAAERGQSDFPAEKDYPENVEKCVSEFNGFMPDFLFKRKSAEARNFKALDPGGNSDYCNTKEKPCKSPFEPKKKSAENEPEKVSQSFHYNLSPFLKNILQKLFAKLLYHKFFQHFYFCRSI